MSQTDTYQRIQVGERLKKLGKQHFLMLPLVVFEIIAFIFPFLILIRISLTRQSGQSTFEQGTWTLSSFGEVLSSGFNHYVIGFSIFFAAVTTLIALIISVFYAYAAWRASPHVRRILLFASVLPLLTTLAVKTYAWMPLFSPAGTLNRLLMTLSIIQEPVSFAPGIVGAVVGQVYNMIPFGILPIYSVLTTLQWEKVEAARDLGARPVRSFYEVVFPHIIPGIGVASVIFITWGLGSYAAPVLLGSGSERTFAVEIESLLLSNFSWSLAAAMSVVMLLIGAIGVITIFSFLNRVGGGVQLVE